MYAEAYSGEQVLGLFQVQVAEILSFTELMDRSTGLSLPEIAALEHLLQAYAHGADSAGVRQGRLVRAQMRRSPAIRYLAGSLSDGVS